MALVFITGADDYKAVRANIHVSLKPANLPDDIITLDSFAGQAERYVGERTLNQDLDTAAGQHAKQAAVYYTAALLIDTVPKLKSQSVAGASFTLDSENWRQRKSELYSLANQEILRSEELNKTVQDPPSQGYSPFEVAESGVGGPVPGSWE